MSTGQSLIVKENKFYKFLPSIRIEFYTLTAIGLVVTFAYIATKESSLILLIMFWSLYLIPQIIIAINAARRPAETLELHYDGKNLIVTYRGKKNKTDLSHARAITIYEPDPKKQKNYYVMKCLCEKKDKIMAEGLVPGLLVRKKLNQIYDFLKSVAPYIDIVFYGPEN